MELGSRAKELIGEYFNANSQPSQRAPRLTRVRWCPLPEQYYKGNFDATFFYASGCAGIGVVFRDHMGQVIVALSQKIPLVQTLELAEALAAGRAVGFALELSLFSVKLEGDCSRVISALNASKSYNTLFGHVTDECRRVSTSLRFCKFQHVRREGNRLAHALAGRAVLSADTDVWVESLPSDLEDVFQSDLA